MSNKRGMEHDKGINQAVQETKDKLKDSWQKFDADQAKKDFEKASDPEDDTNWTRVSIVVLTSILVAALATGLIRIFF